MKRAKWIGEILVVVLVIASQALLVSCEDPLGSDDDTDDATEEVNDDPDNGDDEEDNGEPGDDSEDYDSFPSVEQYEALLDILRDQSSITRDKIDEALESLMVKQNYDYSFYTSDNYISHDMTWSYFSTDTYDWIYYVNIDIWTYSDTGELRESMCDYYSQ